MDETYTTQAIILKREPYRERDSRIVALSAERGKLKLVVRGTGSFKSKMAGHIEPASIADIMVIRGRICDYAGSVLSENAYPNIKTDLARISLAGRALKTADKAVNLNEAEGASDLFALLKGYLDILEAAVKEEADQDGFFYFFLLKLLIILGYAPELYDCRQCGKRIVSGKNFFSPEKGGLECGNCHKEFDKKDLLISDDCVKVLRLVIKSELIKLSRLKINNKLSKEVNDIIGSFKNYHVDF